MLLKKYKHAQKGLATTCKAYDSLQKSLDPVKIRAWKKQEEEAMRDQGEKLQIFEVKTEKGGLIKLNIFT